jgi:hypothetical protein
MSGLQAFVNEVSSDCNSFVSYVTDLRTALEAFSSVLSTLSSPERRITLLTPDSPFFTDTKSLAERISPTQETLARFGALDCVVGQFQEQSDALLRQGLVHNQTLATKVTALRNAVNKTQQSCSYADQDAVGAASHDFDEARSKVEKFVQDAILFATQWRHGMLEVGGPLINNLLSRLERNWETTWKLGELDTEKLEALQREELNLVNVYRKYAIPVLHPILPNPVDPAGQAHHKMIDYFQLQSVCARRAPAKLKADYVVDGAKFGIGLAVFLVEAGYGAMWKVETKKGEAFLVPSTLLIVKTTG